MIRTRYIIYNNIRIDRAAAARGYRGDGSARRAILVWSIVSRYRMADAIGRQQLKWFIVSMLVAVVGIGSATIRLSSPIGHPRSAWPYSGLPARSSRSRSGSRSCATTSTTSIASSAGRSAPR